MKVVAIFIDADNISAHYSQDIITTAKRYGTISIKRVYTNWIKTQTHTWKDECIKYGLSAVQQFDHLSGKNSSDMAVSIDVMEALFTKQIDVFCLVSSDSDFTPLCTKLQEYGKTVIGMGGKNASKSLINACHEFHYLTKNDIPPPPVFVKPVDAHHQKHRPNPNNDQRLIKAIMQMINEYGNDGKLTTAKLGQTLRAQHPNFNPNFYGYDKIGELLRVMKDFDIENVGSTQYVSLHQAKTVNLPYDEMTPSATIQSATDATALFKDTVLTNALSNAIALHQDADGWAPLNDVEPYLNDTFGILSQNYGYANISDLLKNLSMLFNTKKYAGVYYAQDKRATPTQKTAISNARLPTDELQQDTHLIQILRQGIQNHADNHGWASCANVGAFMREHQLSPKNYGYRNLTELVKALDIFDIKIDNNAHYLSDPNAKPKPTPPVTLENPECKQTDETETPITQELLSLLSESDDDKDLNDIVKDIISTLSPDGDWVRASSVTSHLRRRHEVKASDFGFSTFAELYEQLDGIQCQKQGRVLLIKTI